MGGWGRIFFDGRVLSDETLLADLNADKEIILQAVAPAFCGFQCSRGVAMSGESENVVVKEQEEPFYSFASSKHGYDSGIVKWSVEKVVGEGDADCKIGVRR